MTPSPPQIQPWHEWDLPRPPPLNLRRISADCLNSSPRGIRKPLSGCWRYPEMPGLHRPLFQQSSWEPVRPRQGSGHGALPCALLPGLQWKPTAQPFGLLRGCKLPGRVKGRAEKGSRTVRVSTSGKPLP